MKTFGQIAYEAGRFPLYDWHELTADHQNHWEIIAKAVAEEAVRRMADAVVEEAKVFRSGSHN